MEAMGENLNRPDSRPAACGEPTAKEVRGGMGIEEYVDRIAEEMHERVEHQRRIFKQVLASGGDALGPTAYCPLVDCPRLSRLQAVLQETIWVLEETRSSFKSKKLEVMRKKLIDILAGV
ncbi:MAG: hypothetical protein HZA60_10865 [Deltaproteobacteria bacterium]|nr:hypothetical protein [Deltaproteobacteria bacterium]